mgnify:CR=1 FL=1
MLLCFFFVEERETLNPLASGRGLRVSFLFFFVDESETLRPSAGGGSFRVCFCFVERTARLKLEEGAAPLVQFAFALLGEGGSALLHKSLALLRLGGACIFSRDYPGRLAFLREF